MDITKKQVLDFGYLTENCCIYTSRREDEVNTIQGGDMHISKADNIFPNDLTVVRFFWSNANCAFTFLNFVAFEENSRCHDRRRQHVWWHFSFLEEQRNQGNQSIKKCTLRIKKIKK